MKNIAAHDIAVALRPLGFQMQADRNGVMFVRPNATTADLFERLECVYVGRPSDMRFSSGLWTGKTIVLSVSLSVVRHAALQLRGLVTGDGWPEVSTDAERRDRVTCRDRREITEWLTHLADRAPERFERLVREKGDTLLAETKKAREWAATIADTIVARRALADALREPFADLTREETKLANALMKLQFAVPSQEDVSGMAIAALIRSGDDAVASLGRALQTVSTPTVIDTIEWLKRSVPDDDLIWRIRLLVDRILIWREGSLITK